VRARIDLKSPAKLNLFLKVLRRRSDGYHELASLFQAISLCDDIHIELDTQDHFTCSRPDLPQDAANLAWRALCLFRQKTGLNFQAKIHLQKRIPIEAGLGGGSSNAATVLYGLNHLLKTNLSDQELSAMGAELGSDVPFFFSEGTALCFGRGEIVRHLQPLLFDCHLVKPQFGVKTPKVFSCLNVAALKKRDLPVIIHNFYEGVPLYFNDLEAPAYLAEPRLLAFKNMLSAKGSLPLYLTGSGSCFFSFQKEPFSHMPDAFTSSASAICRAPDAWYTQK